jgi:hypothetical protein
MADHKYKSMHHQEAYVVFVQDHKKGWHSQMDEEMESNLSYL